MTPEQAAVIEAARGWHKFGGIYVKAEDHDRAVDVLYDAVAHLDAAEQSTPEPEGLTVEPPVGSVVADRDGGQYVREPCGWRVGTQLHCLPWARLLNHYGPLTLVSTPEPDVDPDADVHLILSHLVADMKRLREELGGLAFLCGQMQHRIEALEAERAEAEPTTTVDRYVVRERQVGPASWCVDDDGNEEHDWPAVCHHDPLDLCDRCRTAPEGES